MELLEGTDEAKAGNNQCTMCTACARVASRKTYRQPNPDPKILDAGNSTGIGPASNPSRQLRSFPAKKPGKKATDTSKTAPDTSKETSKEKTSAKRKADESTNAGTKHCKFILTDMSCFFS
jgi:hypothetical protein